MSAQRLSKLQKQILVTLSLKDKQDEQGFYKDKNVKPPYWHSTKNAHTTLADGIIFRQIKEKGVLNTIKDSCKYNEKTFAPSFSRSIRNLHDKGFIEKPERLNGHNSFDLLKLTNKGLTLTSDIQNLTIRHETT